MFIHVIFATLLIIVAAPLAHAALPMEAQLARREAVPHHFTMTLSKVEVMKRAQPLPQSGDAICRITGRVTMIGKDSDGWLTTHKDKGDLTMDIDCSSAAYPVAPGGFAISVTTLQNAFEIMLWGAIEHAEAEVAQFNAVDARVE